MTAQNDNDSGRGLTTLSDEQLLQASQTGSVDAFTTLYKRYLHKVRGNVTNRLRWIAVDDTDDLVQEVFATLARYSGRFIQGSCVSSFLLQTTHRVVTNHIKHACRERRDVRRNVHAAHDTMPDTRESERAENAEMVAHYLERLTPAEAEIVRLMDLENHTAASAAEVIEAPMTTAQWRHRKAWEHIRALVDAEQAAVA